MISLTGRVIEPQSKLMDGSLVAEFQAKPPFQDEFVHIRADILINTVLAVSVLQAASPAQRYRCELLPHRCRTYVVCVSVCLAQLCAVQKQLIRPTCHLGCTDSSGSREPCIRCGYKYPHGKGAPLKGSTYAGFCRPAVKCRDYAVWM